MQIDLNDWVIIKVWLFVFWHVDSQLANQVINFYASKF